ncbi:MAG: cation diffusion facilitator family transporter, partial [Clostridia bacterium]|nr:cation diffusion facilitator family transporter [Clostridia bacterium]
MDRSKTVFRTSFLGIAANLFLVAFKSVIGLISGSIAIILDAVNNLSDILSSLITIIGTKLACKAPDKKHPYGHGRFEYIASLAIAMVVVFAGITSMIEAVKRIIQPAETSYVPVMLVFLVLGIGVKLAVGLYFRAVGKKIR